MRRAFVLCVLFLALAAPRIHAQQTTSVLLDASAKVTGLPPVGPYAEILATFAVPEADVLLIGFGAKLAPMLTGILLNFGAVGWAAASITDSTGPVRGPDLIKGHEQQFRMKLEGATLAAARKVAGLGVHENRFATTEPPSC
jgi:hypothetical protein